MTSGGYVFSGGEFLVNTTRTGLQSDVSTTALPSGGFVMCWTDTSGIGGDASGSGVKAQIYDALGNKLGSEFLVNTATANAQDQSSIAALSSGRFVVTWTDATGDADRQGIKAQIFEADGTKVGSEFVVNTTTRMGQTNSATTSLANGGFVVSWTDASATAPDATGTGIRAQIYNADGIKVGGEFLVNTTTASSQNYSQISGLASGGFVATWADSSGQGGDPTAPSVKGQIFSATGVKLGGEFLVNTSTALAQDQPVVASLSNGGFVVAWRDLSGVGDTSAAGLKAQVYSATGTKVGGEFQVNTTELNTQDQPTITAIPTGGFAVSWEDNSLLASDASGLGIKTQVFDNLGNRLGGEFQVNTTSAGNQQMPAITALASGALVVSWTDYSGQGGDTDGGIKSQILAPVAGVISGLTISNTQMSEVAVENTIIASLTANGALNATYSYQLIDDSTGGAFNIDGNRLEVKNSLLLDYETDAHPTVTIRVTDTFGNSFDKVFSMTLTDATVETRFEAGDEKLINTAIAGNQQQSSMAALSSGKYVTVWSDGSGQGGDASSYGIKGQIVDATGAKVGSEFLINTQTLNSQDSAVVVGLPSGGFMVSWVDSSGIGADTSSSGIKAQMFDAGGAPIGSEFLVNSSTLNAQRAPAATELASGGFVIAWADLSLQGGDASVSSVKAQLFSSSGDKVGGEFLVNTNTGNRQDTPVVAALTSGGFVISWADSSGIGGDSSKDSIKAQMFDSTGAKIGSEFLVDTETTSNQQQETITSLDNGGFVISWADASNRGGDTDNYGIKLQIYDASGARVGGEILANTTIAGAQIAPTISAIAGGGFVVSWADYSGLSAETGTAGIKGQIFTANGTRIGGEFIVNSQTLGSQVDPVATATHDGGFAIGWTDYSGQGGDDSGTSVKIKLFDPLASQGPPPTVIANGDTVAATEDTISLYDSSTLLANDTDSSGLPLTLTGVTAVSGGTVSIDQQGKIAFTPFANFSGVALFNYTIMDSAGVSATGRVTVNVAGVNDAPTAVADAVNASQNGSVIQGSTLIANDTDVDLGDVLSILSIAATSQLGVQLTLSSGNITYAPGTALQYLGAGQTATDSFAYTVTDQAGATSTANVSVTVVGVNDAPVNLTLAGQSVDENAANGTVVGTLAAQDPDQSDTLLYSLTNNAGGRFAVNATTGVITVANGALLDYETAASQTVIARTTDSSGAYVESSFVISLNNLPEPKSWTGDNGVNIFTAPTNDLWTINGLGGNDILNGNASADTIYGGIGNDILDGKQGADTLYGGTGNDTFYVDNIGDRVIENVGEGTDLVYSSVDYTLPVNVENLTQTGTADLAATGNDFANTITGNAGANIMHGGLGGDLLVGGDGNDTLYGEAGSDFLQGGNGNDILIGAAGADELTGGAGADHFVFDSLTTSAERDKVKDFVHGEDIFDISGAVFGAFANTPPGALPASAFVNGTAATTADQHLIYQQSTGFLYYDPDGVGGAAQIQIAVLSTLPSLTSTDFHII